jgi:hypothetical protein
VFLWLERSASLENQRSVSPFEQRSSSEILQIDYLTIGTPNEVKVLGPITQMTAIVALLAAILALPKAPLEREQLRASVAKTEADSSHPGAGTRSRA